ncbi:MAG: hypothetical protein US94_C0002G0035 [Berkelbacteria bacterium GW2011_GWB1_38_5]|uniref:Uncharacterized protein n=2 Tax=Candidatus Berkelbacteria TaxID=1618330 RepID=A0A0G0PNX0_9BACT|nr:MAG: hypothetical protein US94_C0002G0035 [Berkelbacteria bacterium GW2011_GWB1_38_5]KKQ91026.1 MAG: hypothetical protein UT15_C0001G0006 [Berkelbacteria bacterium GW2011_GWA1_39_10]
MRKVLLIILIIIGLGVLGLASYSYIAPKLNPENRKIEAWIKTNNLNQYGDLENTAYSGGTPLFNPVTGKTTDRYDYIKNMHPNKPWNK